MTTSPSRRPLQVSVIGNYRPDRQESMQRYGAMIVSLLASPGIEPSFHVAPPRLGRFARGSGLAKWLGYIDKFVIFPFAVARIAARSDVVHICDHSNALYCRFTGPVPTLLTCHDLLAVRAATGDFPAQRPALSGRVLQWMIRTSLRHADHVACVSEATRRDVERVVGPVPTTAIENPLHYPYAPMSPVDADHRLALAGLPAGRYFLHVGGNQWYKNRAGVVALFAAIARDPAYREHRLLLAGKPLPASLWSLIDDLGLRDRVVAFESPDDAILNALYCRAEALLFPSLAEGFGWPIVEAQAAGCLVVTSDRAPMCDVAGTGGAILVDPEDPERGAAAFLAAANDFDRFREAGFANARRHESDRVAPRYRELVQRLAEREAA